MTQNIESVPAKSRRRVCGAASNAAGTVAVSGQPIFRRSRLGKDLGDGRTSRAIKHVVLWGADLARLHIPSEVEGRPIELNKFIEDAIVEKTWRTLALVPGAVLPAGCVLPAVVPFPAPAAEPVPKCD